MKINKFIYFAVALSLGLASCEPEFKNELSDADYSAGDADFTSYVAVGNSLTSGFMDGTMFRTGQQYSFPNFLAKQFSIVGGGEFTQPSYEDDVNNVGGLMLGGNQITDTKLIINAQVGGPQNINAVPTSGFANLQRTAYNNMGVPGAKSFHLLAAGYGNIAGLAIGKANPYFVRHATSDNATVLGDAMSKNPTFFTNWIGSNDVLAYAMSGGTGVNQTGNLYPSTYGSNDITDANVFGSVYSTIVNTLTSNGAKGVVATIPNVSAIPYFTTVPYNPLSPTALGGAATINALNTSLLGPVKQILTAYGQGDRIQLFTATAANPLLIKDEYLTDLSAQLTGALVANGIDAQTAGAIGMVFGQARHAKATDLFILPTSKVIGTASGMPAPFDKLGVTFPLADNYTLVPQEQTEIATATTQFNAIIKSVAASKDLAVADMNAIMNKLASESGIKLSDGVVYTSDYFSTTGLSTVLFSLDGVHPNARGYALVANEVIKAIESKYKAKLPKLNPGSYPGATILTSN